jgi:hypothetical protein
MKSALRADPAIYCSHYCEENALRLAAHLGVGTHVLLISNGARAVTLRQQLAGGSPRTVVWDYHVLLLDAGGPEVLVFDLDSALPFPSPLPAYISAALPEAPEPGAAPPRFRLVPLPAYEGYLSSDRSHMRDPASGAWLMPPPPWPPYCGPCSGGVPHTLSALWDVESGGAAAAPGVLLDAAGLLAWGARAAEVAAAYTFRAADALAEARALAAAPAAPAAPFAGLYAARGALRAAAGALVAAGAAADEEGTCFGSTALRDALATLAARLGANYVDAEETGDGEALLLEGVPWLLARCGVAARVAGSFSEGRGAGGGGARAGVGVAGALLLLAAGDPPPARWLPAPLQMTLLAAAMDGASQLAALHAGWDNHARALRALRASKAAYRAVCSWWAVPPPPPPPPPAIAAEVESQLTHAAFFFAQVYGHLGAPGVAARYVERTLCRQLRAWEEGSGAAGGEPSERLEWARNALRLGSYHMAGTGGGPPAWAPAAACFAAGDYMLGWCRAHARAEEAVAASATGAPAGGGGGDSGGGAQEAAVLLASGPPVAPGEATVAAAARAAYNDALARAVAEAALHWGGFYEAVLRFACEEREAGGVAARGGGGGDGGAAAPPPPPDPFSTLPAISFGAGKEGPLRGSGSDALSIDDSDHEVEVVAGPWVPPAPAPAAAAPTCPPLLRPLQELPPDAPLRACVASFAPIALGGVPYPGPLGAPPPSGLRALPLPSAVIDFPSARAVFLSAQAALARAHTYFVLDGFVTEHRSATASLERCWKYLSLFEADPKRLGAMHARRAALLGDLGAALSPSAYGGAVKELCYGAGIAWVEAMDARAAAGASGAPGAAAAKGVNAAADAALAAFTRFLRCFSDPRFTDAPLAPVGAEAPPPFDGAAPVPPGEEVPFATAHFFCARSLFRRDAGTAAARLRDTADCLLRTRWFLKALPQLGADAQQALEAEAGIAEQLCEVLPLKLRSLAPS